MDRSLWAVMGGTFTLRFSTGLTGAMLAVYLAKLPEHGGPVVAATTLAILHATFYLSELVLSPVFGVLSDRLGHHRVMLFGPVFGAVAVILTGLTTNLTILGGTRLLEGASTAASVPSILGYIALATATSEVLRGKAAARFEGATLAGFGVGFAAAPLLFAAFGPVAFYLNAVIYGVSFLIYRFGVEDHDREEREAAASSRASRMDLSRYGALLRTSHVWLLAPTWIAVNASIGLWFSQSIFQFSQANASFPGPIPPSGLQRGRDLADGRRCRASCSASVCCTGATDSRASDGRRSSSTGSSAVASSSPAGWPSTMAPACRSRSRSAVRWPRRSDCSCWPARRQRHSACWPTSPSASRPIVARSWASTACSSRSGQITGSLIGGFAAEWRGIDGLLLATFALLLVALVPLAQLRRHEHYVGGPEQPASFDEAEPAE